jgi:hypothetical protein
MTSNRERDFPPAFNRRCIRVAMPHPAESDTLKAVVLAHFRPEDTSSASEHPFLQDSPVPEELQRFLDLDKNQELATDQLLNALQLLTLEQQGWQAPTDKAAETLRGILYRGLDDRDDDR